MSKRTYYRVPLAPEGMKVCSRCKGEPQPYASFNKNKSMRDGYNHWCRTCMKAKWDERGEFYKRNYKYSTENNRRQHHKSKYDLTEERYLEMLKEQDGRCLICGTVMTNPNVDHDHLTDKVRALLCPPCNKMLGLARDSVSVLLSAVSYLRRFSA